MKEGKVKLSSYKAPKDVNTITQKSKHTIEHMVNNCDCQALKYCRLISNKNSFNR